MYQPTVSQQPALRTSHVDFLLSFVLGRSATPEGGVAARLDALERTFAMLTRQWRSDSMLAPVRELRMSAETLATLLAWLDGDGPADRTTLERLGVYASGALTDRTVAAGWVRVHLI